jgi:HEPN domain-containing protein
MPDDPRILKLIGMWWAGAAEDLAVARQSRTHPRASSFHSQQAVEKAIKSLLVQQQQKFEKTHDIGDLLSLLNKAGIIAPTAEIDGLTELTQFAVETRYPPRNVTAEEAKDALAKAERFLLWVRQQLPKEV